MNEINPCAIINEKEEQKLQKKKSVFMYGISSFMVVVVLVIGINLMNSYEKMKNLDQSLSSIALQMSNMNDNGREGEDTAGGVVSVNKLEEMYIRPAGRVCTDGCAAATGTDRGSRAGYPAFRSEQYSRKSGN